MAASPPSPIGQLLQATSQGQVHHVQYYINHEGVDINGRDDTDGWTALIEACDIGHVPIAIFLADHDRIDLNARTDYGSTALVRAAATNRVTLVQHLLRKPAIQVNIAEKSGWTALHYASHSGYEQVCRLLLQHPHMDCTIQDVNGKTPYDLAVEQNHAEVQAILLDHLHSAMMSSSTDTADLAAEEIRLLQAARFGHVPTVEGILQSSSDRVWNVNAAFATSGQTALHVAVTQGHSAVVQLLCDNGHVVVNTRDKKGWTPLHWACWGNRVDCARILLDHRDIDLLAVNQDGDTPLDVTSRTRRNSNSSSNSGGGGTRRTVRQCLMEHLGRDLNHGSPASSCLANQFLNAAKTGRRSELEHLIRHCQPQLIPSEILSSNGMTALHWSARHGHLSTVQFLGKAEALLVSVQDDQGRTALHEACRWADHAPIVEYLLKHMTPTDVALRNHDGHTALQVALLRQLKATVRLFLDHESGVDPHEALKWMAQSCDVAFLKVFHNNAIAEFLLEHHGDQSANDYSAGRSSKPKKNSASTSSSASSTMDRALKMWEDRGFMRKCLRKALESLLTTEGGGGRVLTAPRRKDSLSSAMKRYGSPSRNNSDKANSNKSNQPTKLQSLVAPFSSMTDLHRFPQRFAAAAAAATWPQTANSHGIGQVESVMLTTGREL